MLQTHSTATQSHTRLYPLTLPDVTAPSGCRLLTSCYLRDDFFDLIDVDCFGSETTSFGAALSAVRYGGMLYLTSTDGFSAGGE
jgi:tRNA (guanine26-N2/guanine27-N2)-dimethyltransferase